MVFVGSVSALLLLCMSQSNHEFPGNPMVILFLLFTIGLCVAIGLGFIEEF
jgi:hypothetical protein